MFRRNKEMVLLEIEQLQAVDGISSRDWNLLDVNEVDMWSVDHKYPMQVERVYSIAKA